LSFSIIASPLVFAQLIEHHVPQVIQRFSKLHRVDQGTARPVIAVQLVQVGAGDQKRGDPPAVIAHPDPVQPGAHAQQKCAFKQIGHFNGTFQWDLTSFQLIDFFWEMR
jgi:hypothetical protein